MQSVVFVIFNFCTGEIVTTGRALDREAAASHALEVQASDGTLACTARVHVRLLDINDHAPVFAQRFYDIRVPAPLAPPAHEAVLALPQVRPTHPLELLQLPRLLLEILQACFKIVE